MSANNFEVSLKHLLVSEGSDSDDPADHGGRTHNGIIQREYDAYRKREGLPLGDVYKATDAEVKQIYHDSYWFPYCDSLPTGIDYLLFDMRVLQGAYAAAKILQRGLGVEADGHIGIITQTALSLADRPTVVTQTTIKRIQFFRSLHQPRFLKGWLNRARRVEKEALAMIPDKRIIS